MGEKTSCGSTKTLLQNNCEQARLLGFLIQNVENTRLLYADAIEPDSKSLKELNHRWTIYREALLYSYYMPGLIYVPSFDVSQVPDDDGLWTQLCATLDFMKQLEELYASERYADCSDGCMYKGIRNIKKHLQTMVVLQNTIFQREEFNCDINHPSDADYVQQKLARVAEICGGIIGNTSSEDAIEKNEEVVHVYEIFVEYCKSYAKNNKEEVVFTYSDEMKNDLNQLLEKKIIMAFNEKPDFKKIKHAVALFELWQVKYGIDDYESRKDMIIASNILLDGKEVTRGSISTARSRLKYLPNDICKKEVLSALPHLENQ